MKLADVVALCVEEGFVSEKGAKALRRLAQTWPPEAKEHVEKVIGRGVLYEGDIYLFRLVEQEASHAVSEQS